MKLGNDGQSYKNGTQRLTDHEAMTGQRWQNKSSELEPVPRRTG